MWFILLGRPDPERVQTAVVSDNFFDLLGVKPLLGRTFQPGEDQQGAAPVLVLSYNYLAEKFCGRSERSRQGFSDERQAAHRRGRVAAAAGVSESRSSFHAGGRVSVSRCRSRPDES